MGLINLNDAVLHTLEDPQTQDVRRSERARAPRNSRLQPRGIADDTGDGDCIELRSRKKRKSDSADGSSSKKRRRRSD